jgi:hypothetical protein
MLQHSRHVEHPPVNALPFINLITSAGQPPASLDLPVQLEPSGA